jgi:hypothetical protein
MILFLEKSITEKTQTEMRKYMDERERINGAITKDPHQSDVLSQRI